MKSMHSPHLWPMKEIRERAGDPAVAGEMEMMIRRTFSLHQRMGLGWRWRIRRMKRAAARLL